MTKNKPSKIKAAMAIFLMVSMSLTVLIALMPTAVAVGERIEGTVTEAGTGNFLEFFGVVVLYEDMVGDPLVVFTDVNGDYGIDVPGAGDYGVLFSNMTWSGMRVEVTVGDGLTVTGVDYVATPDNTEPVITTFETDQVDGISTEQPATFDVTITEDHLLFVEVQILRYLDKEVDTGLAQFVKGYFNVAELKQMPGVEYEDIVVAPPPTINTTQFVFDGTVKGADFSNGTDSWWITVSEWNDTAVAAFAYYENDTIGANDNLTFPVFNSTTGVLEEIGLFNETNGLSWVPLNAPGGKLQMMRETQILNWSEIPDPFNDDEESGTPMVDIGDIQPLQFNDVLPSGDYLVSLEVQDFGDTRARDWMNVTVDNDVPVADAGLNITIKQGETVTFNGSASSDNMGIVNHSWNYSIGATSYEVYDWNATTEAFADIGLVEVDLTITDIGGWTDTDTMYINVTDGVGPVADAGANITAMQEVEFMFNGSALDNVDVKADMNFTWTFNDTVEVIELYGWNATYTLSDIGVYNVSLLVTDQSDNSGDVVLMWVYITDGHTPVAVAGDDLDVKQGDEVLFNGNASTDNVGIVNYTWDFNAAGLQVALYGWNATHVFDYIEVVNVTLTVKDEAGLSASDNLFVNVTDGLAPVVDAGVNQTLELGNVVDLNGSASTDNVGIVNYTWDFGDGTTAEGMALNHTYAAIGNYTVMLTCLDANGNSANDTLMVYIVPVNHAPVISAISAQSVTEDEAFTYTVTATDENEADILTFSLLEAPTGMTINETTGVLAWTPTHAMVGNTYDVTVEVTDGTLATNLTFQVTVNSAIPETLSVTVGPIKDKDGKAIKGAEVTIMLGAESRSGKTDANGFVTITVPGEWGGDVVTIKVSKKDYKSKSFTGTIATDGAFTPTDGYPKIAAEDTGEDYTFLLIVIIVLVVLALVLLSMRKPVEEEDELDEDEDEEKEEKDEKKEEE